MSDNEEVQVETKKQPIEENQAVEADTLDELFSERKQEIKKRQEDEPEEEEEPIKKAAEKVKPKNKEKVVDKDVEQKKSKEVSSQRKEEFSEVEELRKKAEKLESVEKSLSDTQKWAHSINRKLKSIQKEVTKSIQNGDFTEEQTNFFTGLLQSNSTSEEDEVEESQNPLSKLINIALTRRDDLRDAFEHDKDFDGKASAFDFFIRNASGKQLEEVIDELSELEKHPFKLAKKMYSVGEEFFDCYKDIENAGGVLEYYELVKKKEEKFKKDIDKLKSKLAQYEDHDKPTYRINELGGDVSQEEPEEQDALSEVLSERARNMRRR